MPIGTAFHPRTSALCESMSWRDWSGYFAVSTYEVHHEREYNAIRNAAALIDISPLFKYRVSGKDAIRLVDRVITRDANKIAVGQVVYTHWCDGEGKVIDDGTVSRLGPDLYRWTAAEPNLRWISQNAHGLEVKVEDISDRTAAVALQGPTSRAVLESCAETDVPLGSLKYFRVTRGRVGAIPVEVSRTGYTGDLGYEVWVAAERAVELWDALFEAGRPYDITPAGMFALDVARIEAGLILLDVDYVSAKKALVPSQKYTPYEIGLGRLVHLDKAPFVGQAALKRESVQGPKRGLGRPRAALRRGGAASTASGHRVAGVRPPVPERHPDRQGDEHDVVSDPQEDDRPRQRHQRHGGGRHPPRHGADGRPPAAAGPGGGRQAAVLRSPPQAGLNPPHTPDGEERQTRQEEN
jgi:glycine cleavage system T protein (aminomethyltransferase)